MQCIGGVCTEQQAMMILIAEWQASRHKWHLLIEHTVQQRVTHPSNGRSTILRLDIHICPCLEQPPDYIHVAAGARGMQHTAVILGPDTHHVLHLLLAVRCLQEAIHHAEAAGDCIGCCSKQGCACVCCCNVGICACLSYAKSQSVMHGLSCVLVEH